jgi:hypothetical protein
MTPFDTIMKYMGIIMAVLYVAVGIALLWRANELFNMPSKYALPLGGLLVLYGVFRGYRVIQKHFQR